MDQYLPNYKHEFLNDPRWIQRESEHYIFNYFSNSVAERDIELIVSTQENAFNKIIETLKLPEPKEKIRYYIYPDETTKISLMGNDWYAQAIRAEWCIHILYTKNDRPIGAHEDTHLISLPWGISIGFYQEGLAEYVVGHAWDGKPHIEYVKDGYKKEYYPSLSVFFEHEVWMGTDDSKALYFYSLAGAFTNYLIQKFGLEKFKTFYTQSNRKLTYEENKKIFESNFEKIDVVEYDFKKNIGL